MMKEIKKYSSYFIRYILVISIITLYFIAPIKVDAKEANTLRGLRNELSQLEAKKKANSEKKSLTKSQINTNTKNIANAEAEITKSQQQIETSKQLIVESNKKIDELTKKNEELMVYYQLMQGENVYMEFITDSSSMTELIMRSDAVNQLVSYQQEKLNELNDLIEENEKLQVDLKKYEDTLASNITKYESAIDSLQGDLSSLNEIGMDLDDEINSKKQLIKTYADMGCKEDQDLDECAALAGNATWLKPFAKGRVNSIFGERISPITHKKQIHKAVDIGGNPEGTKVYAIGNAVVVGMVDATGKYNSKKKTTCGGNQIYLQMTVAGENYIVGYAHLLEIHVKVGQKVTSTTVIGLQGGGPRTKKWETCSTGTHLHLSVAKGTPRKNQSLANFVATKAIKPPGYPARGGWWHSRSQFF